MLDQNLLNESLCQFVIKMDHSDSLLTILYLVSCSCVLLEKQEPLSMEVTKITQVLIPWWGWGNLRGDHWTSLRKIYGIHFATPFLGSSNLGTLVLMINLKGLNTTYWLPWTSSSSAGLKNRRSTLQNYCAAPAASPLTTFTFSSRGLCASNIFLSPIQSLLTLLQLYFLINHPNVWENQERISLL